MLRIRNGRLPKVAKEQLAIYQTEVNQHQGYATQVAAAKRLFGQRNKAKNATFLAVRTKLTEMCNGPRRCMYCEDSVADEVEHFKPKDLYPDVVFSWANYLFACGPCNGPKNNKFCVVDVNGNLLDVTRSRNQPVVPPLKGSSALINPRRENPLEFFWLDLKNTFEFTAHPNLIGVAQLRAEYTLDVLGLNSRDYLRQARKNAFDGFLSRLSNYVGQQQVGATATQLNRIKSSIQRSPHITVWKEIQRQQLYHAKLRDLFAAAPVALEF